MTGPDRRRAGAASGTGACQAGSPSIASMMPSERACRCCSAPAAQTTSRTPAASQAATSAAFRYCGDAATSAASGCGAATPRGELVGARAPRDDLVAVARRLGDQALLMLERDGEGEPGHRARQRDAGGHDRERVAVRDRLQQASDPRSRHQHLDRSAVGGRDDAVGFDDPHDDRVGAEHGRRPEARRRRRRSASALTRGRRPDVDEGAGDHRSADLARELRARSTSTGCPPTSPPPTAGPARPGAPPRSRPARRRAHRRPTGRGPARRRG